MKSLQLLVASLDTLLYFPLHHPIAYSCLDRFLISHHHLAALIVCYIHSDFCQFLAFRKSFYRNSSSLLISPTLEIPIQLEKRNMFSRSIFVATATLIFIDGLLALQVTSPATGATWSTSSPNTVAWTSVASDPSSFDVVLVNNDPNCAPTGTSQVVQRNVSTAQGSHQIGAFSSVKPCDGYQINLVAPNNGILAQSAPFNLTGTTSASINSTVTPSASTSGSFNVTHTAANSTSNATSSTRQSFSGDNTKPNSTSTRSGNVNQGGMFSNNNSANPAGSANNVGATYHTLKSLSVALILSAFTALALL